MFNTPQEPHQRANNQSRIWHPYTRFSTLVEESLPVIVRGEGCHLIAEDGTRYFDAISSWWCMSLGHGRSEIIKAIQQKANELQHSILGNLTHPSAEELAARLAGMMPTPDRHVLFASDGSSAVEQAVKIAIQYRANIGQRKRTRIACLEGAYHGDTLGAMALGYLEHFHKPYEHHLFPAVRLPFPACSCRAEPCRNKVPDCFQAARQILDAHADELTAVIVEPLLQGASGMRLYGEAWLRALSTWCREHDVLLILDEIATGFGRTGDWFAFCRADVDPDIICLGKGLSGGYLPISATVVHDRIYETFSDQPIDHTLQHGHTFCGNPIAAAAALAALQCYQSGIIAGVPAKASLLERALAPARSHGRVRDIRLLGLMAAIELHPETEPPGRPTIPHRIRRRLKENKILLRPLGQVLYIMPPLVTPDHELEWLAGMLIDALDTP